MNAQPITQRRRYYRIQFPLAERPRLSVDGKTFVVLNLAETNCRICRRGPDSINDSDSIGGVMKFGDGSEVTIEGVVLCHDATGIVIQFTSGVPLKKMTELQRVLYKKYPNLRNLEQQDYARMTGGDRCGLRDSGTNARLNNVSRN